jgi:flagellar biosynthesis component FlhA
MNNADVVEQCCHMLASELSKINQDEELPVLMVSPALRPIAAHLLRRELPGLQVISTQEVVADMHLETTATVGRQLAPMLTTRSLPVSQAG